MGKLKQNEQATFSVFNVFMFELKNVFFDVLKIKFVGGNKRKSYRLQKSFFTTKKIIFSLPFSGGVVGEFFICLKFEDWSEDLSAIIESSGQEQHAKTDDLAKELFFSAFQEILNNAAGKTLSILREHFGSINLLSPRVIEGTLHYPKTRVVSAQLVASGGGATKKDIEVMFAIDYMEQEIAVLSEKLKHESRYDYTGLFNKKHFMKIKKEWESSAESFCLIYGDLNRLKYINDHYGHDIGDLYIQLVCDLLKQSCRFSDLCFRIGGDELIIYLPNSELKDGKRVLRRLKKLIVEHEMIFQDKLGAVKREKIYFSVGMASSSEVSNNTEVLSLAETRMEEEKRNWYEIMNLQRRK